MGRQIQDRKMSTSSASVEEPGHTPGRTTLVPQVAVPATVPVAPTAIGPLQLKPVEPVAGASGQSFIDSIFSVQRKESQAPANQVHQAAAAGIQGSGGSLPYMDLIQASFGPQHDVSGVAAHVGGPATEACASMGASAYATGTHVAFDGAPTLHTAAHEAAHVVQQRAGVHLKSGVGEVGDPYEQNADAVADRVVQGLPAADLLPAPGGGGGGVQHKPVQLYAKVPGMPYNRLSDDGKLAVVDHGREGWADSSMIASSNTILKQKHSKGEIEELSGGDITVPPPGAAAGAATITLKKFRMKERGTSNELETVDDCGGANQQLLGAEHHGSAEFVAANQRGTTQEFTNPESYHADDRAPGGDLSTTEVLSGQIYIRIFAREFKKTLSREDALKEWAKLGKLEQDRLSKKYGINQFAVPKVGQGVTIGSERDMPGSTGAGYNFHFALNLMMSGADYITLEDYDQSGVKYYFDMYGPESKGQAFAQDPSNTGATDANTTTMVVDHPENLKGTVNENSTLLVDDPALMDNQRVLSKGDKVKIVRKGNSWMKVTVESGKKSGEVGWIMNKYFSNN